MEKILQRALCKKCLINHLTQPQTVHLISDIIIKYGGEVLLISLQYGTGSLNLPILWTLERSYDMLELEKQWGSPRNCE
jgi:hypothetical protein